MVLHWTEMNQMVNNDSKLNVEDDSKFPSLALETHQLIYTWIFRGSCATNTLEKVRRTELS
jgi:hypothetical protein